MWRRPPLAHPFQGRDHRRASPRAIGLDYLTVPTLVIHDREGSEPAPVEHRVRPNVPTPPLVQLPRLRRHHPQVTRPFSSSA